jgi:hypothetical protein
MILRNTADMSAQEMHPLWPGIYACLSKYVRHFPDEETIENILAECANGKRQLWIVTEGHDVILAAVTEIVTIQATGKKQLVMAECGGRRYAECLELLPEIEKWAREQGASEAVTLCRRGLVRLYEPLGFKAKAVMMRKGL